MILQCIGYTISIILAITAVVCFGASIYFGYKYANNWLPTPKSIKANTKYLLLGMLSLFSSVFVFLTTMNGFSFESLVSVLIGMMIVSFVIMIGHVVSSGTAEYLNKRNIPSPFSDEYPSWLKNSMTKPAPDKDK